MTQPTDQPATDQTLAALIDEAIGARRMLPPYARCQELDEQLRAAIEALLPAVEVQARQATERSRDWYHLTQVVDNTRDILGCGLGHGLLSAAIQLGNLAEQCQVLAAEVR